MPVMQKIINRPEPFVDELLEGISLAHPGRLKTAGDPRAIVRGDAPVSGKVGIATGAGRGTSRCSWATSARGWPTVRPSATSSLPPAPSRCWT